MIRIPLPKKTEKIHKDPTKYNRKVLKAPEITETICCKHCGHEYDRHVGDYCPNCNTYQGDTNE